MTYIPSANKVAAKEDKTKYGRIVCAMVKSRRILFDLLLIFFKGKYS